MNPFPLLGDLMLTEMARSWVEHEIFSDRHVKPHVDELIFQVFPAAKTIFTERPDAREHCGLIFELFEFRDKSCMVKVDHPSAELRMLPRFESCKILPTVQIDTLQRAIDAVRFTKDRSKILRPN